MKLGFMEEIIANVELTYTVQSVSVTETGYFEIFVIENNEYDERTIEKLGDFSYIENIDKDTEKFLGHLKG